MFSLWFIINRQGWSAKLALTWKNPTGATARNVLDKLDLCFKIPHNYYDGWNICFNVLDLVVDSIHTGFPPCSFLFPTVNVAHGRLSVCGSLSCWQWMVIFCRLIFTLFLYSLTVCMEGLWWLSHCYLSFWSLCQQSN